MTDPKEPVVPKEDELTLDDEETTEETSDDDEETEEEEGEEEEELDAAGLHTGNDSKHRKDHSSSVFGQRHLFPAEAEKDRRQAMQKEFDRKVSLLITPNKLKLLREFGYDVKPLTKEMPEAHT